MTFHLSSEIILQFWFLQQVINKNAVYLQAQFINKVHTIQTIRYVKVDVEVCRQIP